MRLKILNQVQNDRNKIDFFSQGSDYLDDSLGDSVSNLGIEYENVLQYDYKIDFVKDSVSTSVSEFDIGSEIESDIRC
jgi:hypothetical protein